MAKYEITAPDGNRYEITAPDNATEDQVLAYAQQNYQPVLSQEAMAAHKIGAVPTEKDFGQRLSEDWGERARKVSAMVGRNTQGGFLEDVVNLPRVGALTAGQIAGGALDVGTEGLRSAYRGLVPERLQQAISTTGGMLADTTPGQLLSRAIQAGGQAYGSFANAYPDAAMALEGAVNIVGLTGAGAGAKKAVPQPTSSSLAKQYSATVKKGIEKAVRPGVEGKRTFGQAGKYFGDAEKATTAIIENVSNLRLTDEAGEAVVGSLPKSLKQFSEAIEQTKRSAFEKYNALAQEAGKAGATVNLTPIADNLSAITKSKPLIDNAPDVVEYAARRAEALAGRGAYTAQEAQEAVSILNKSLDSFYKNPTYDTFSKAFIDSQIAQHLRSGLDNVIENTTTPGYQALKREYGALKAIERDVNRRMIVAGRQNAKGLVEGFTDVLSGGQMVQGLLAANPTTIAQAGAMKGIAKWVKMLNDPDRAVENMFKKASGIKEKIGQTIPKRPAPMGVASVPQGPAPVNTNIPSFKRRGVVPDTTYRYPPMQTPTTMALPAPQGFVLHTPEEADSILADAIVARNLGGKNLPGGIISEGLTAAERKRLNALARGINASNR